MAEMTERDKVHHLLRRFGLGVSPADLERYGEDDHEAVIQQLLDYHKVEDTAPTAETVALPNIGNPVFPQLVWYARLLTTTRPLEEKLTLFWHDHFATSSEKVASGEAMDDHVSTLRRHALGNFRDLLLAVSQDPAMLYWLDNQENIKGKPNENFARELLELFTLGVDNYSENDVLETARAFTGWTLGVQRGRRTLPVRNQLPRRGLVFYVDTPNHDDGQKTVLGRSGALDGGNVIDELVAHPQTARMIARKMWEWFAYANPEPALIERLAQKWRESGMEIRALVQAIMTAPEFYSERAVRKVVKNPVDFCVVTSRQFGLGASLATNLASLPAESEQQAVRRVLAPAALNRQRTTSMGMELMAPPDVDGWKGGESWISTATMIERIKWADALFPPQGANARVFALLRGARNAQGLVDKLLEMFDVDVPATKRAQYVEAADKALNGAMTRQNASPAANAVCRLLFGSPEFQFA